MSSAAARRPEQVALFGDDLPEAPPAPRVNDRPEAAALAEALQVRDCREVLLELSTTARQRGAPTTSTGYVLDMLRYNASKCWVTIWLLACGCLWHWRMQHERISQTRYKPREEGEKEGFGMGQIARPGAILQAWGASSSAESLSYRGGNATPVPASDSGELERKFPTGEGREIRDRSTAGPRTLEEGVTNG